MAWSRNGQISLRARDRITYLLLLPAAPSVRLVQQPCADDRVHVDSNALDAGQQDCPWKAREIKAMINEQFLHTNKRILHMYCAPVSPLEKLSYRLIKPDHYH